MPSYNRREFINSGAAALAAPFATGRPPGVPVHLPPRLSICYYGWEWITSARPDEPYGDLERIVVQTKERGYNCVRAEMGLNWMFDLKGRRRGKLKFADFITGASSNMQCHGYEHGGGVHDVYERVLRLFELAVRHDIYVITTSWEYQDAITELADPKLRDEIIGVPYNDRLMLLASQYDRLLSVLERHGLDRRVAFVEVVNELNQPPIFCAAPGTAPQTFQEWVDAKSPSPPCPAGQVREVTEKAVAYLRERHPQVLVTADLGSSSGFDKIWPRNAQVADHHVYFDGVVQAFWRKAGITGIRPGKAPDVEHNEFLRSMLKPNPMSWEEITSRAGRVRRNWWGIAWLYENLDNAKFDQWCTQHFAEFKPRIQATIDEPFKVAAAFARTHNLPLVVDEGYILYPPVHSRFVTTPEGRWGEETAVNRAIETGHWGILLSGYFRPDTPVWTDESQCEWAKGVNHRILASAAVPAKGAM